MQITRRAIATAAGISILAVTACSSGNNNYNEASWSNTYDTFESVMASTTVVILGEATAQNTVNGSDSDGQPRTIKTAFTVTQAFGAHPNSVTVLSTDGFDPREAAYYEVGKTYLVFLTPAGAGADANEYYAVGQVAAYRVDGQQASRVTSRDKLPVDSTLTELLTLAKPLG